MIDQLQQTLGPTQLAVLQFAQAHANIWTCHIIIYIYDKTIITDMSSQPFIVWAYQACGFH
jgi:hypothetical protein